MGAEKIERRKNTGHLSIMLNQSGPAAIHDVVDFTSRPLPEGTRRTEITRIRAEQKYIKTLLGLDHMSEIPTLRTDLTRYKNAVENAYQLIAGNYDLPSDEIVHTVKGYAELADKVIAYTVKDLPPEFADHGIKSKIKKIDNPVDLAIALFNNDLPQLDRFRALRKLLLMRMAASLDQKETDGQSDKAYQQLKTFFEDEYNPVLDKPHADEDTRRYIVSTHNPNNFATTNTEIINQKKRDSLQLKKIQKLIPVEKRTFTVTTKSGPHTVNIYFSEGIPGTPRKKEREVMLLKQLRDGRENPALSVDDQVGFMAIFEQPDDVNLFLDHLADHAVQRGNMLSLEKVKDTLEKTSDKSTGDPELHWFKAMLYMDGMRPEFIAHTPTTFADYRYRDGLSHAEYANHRLFNEGVVELLFPPELYNYDIGALHTYATNKVRNSIRQ